MAERVVKSDKAALAMQRLQRRTAVAVGRLTQEQDPQHPSPKTQQAVERITGSHSKN